MKKFISFILALSFVLISTLAYSQCMMYPVLLSNRVQQSGFIAEGKIISCKSFWDDSHSMIYTANEIEVYKLFKGSSTVHRITVITEGGQVDNKMVVTNPGIQFKIGDVGMFFIHQGNLQISSATGTLNNYELYAAAQGFMRYDAVSKSATDPFTRYDNIEKDLYPQLLQLTGQQSFVELKTADYFRSEKKKEPMMAPSIGSFSPTSTYAGTLAANVFTITGTNFGSSYVPGTSKLEFKNANDGGASYVTAPDNHIQSWSSTTITAWIPTGAGSGTIRVTNNLGETGTSSTAVTINYNETNVISSGTYYLADLVNDNGSGGYTLAYNTTFNSNTSAVAAFERALGTWRCNTLVNFNRAGTTAIAVNASDGVNVVTFDGASPLSSGVLGTAYSYYSGCGSGVWYLSETDLKFRTDGTGGITWNFGPTGSTSGFTDFESVCVHELGHAHQLGHTNLSPASVMHYAISSGTDRRTLVSTSEVAGGNDIMTRSLITNSCGPTAMAALTTGTCSLGAAPVVDFSASATSICKGATVNFTDKSTNTPTSWSWSFTGATPSISTAQNPTGIKYNSIGTYAVTLTATNSIGSDAETKTGYITVNAVPAATATAGGPTSFCDGGSVLISANTGVGLSYQWKKGSANVSGATASTYTANATGSFKVVVSNASGCSKTSGAVSVTKNPSPAAVITPSGPTSFCAGDSVILTASSGVGNTYQWKKGSTTLSGATGQSYTAKSSGTYKVTVTSSLGCTKASAGISVTASCKVGDEANEHFNVYPNPSASSFTIALNGNQTENASLKIFDLTGRTIQQFELSDELTSFTAGDDLLPGIYFIEFTHEGKAEYLKWIKIK